MFDVVLINPPSNCVEDDHLEPQLGLLYIASVLRENHIHTGIYEMTGCLSEEQFTQKINRIPAASIYGLTTYCTNYPYVKQIMAFLRQFFPRSYIVLGGPNPTALPEWTLQQSQCDCLITGEGEDAFLSVCRKLLRKQEVPKIITGAGRPDIDSYPFPARDLVDLPGYSRTMKGEPVVSLLSSRGCPHCCTHCNSIIMGAGTQPRYRHPQPLCQEIKTLITRGYSKFRFNDDNFCANPNLSTLLTGIAPLHIQYRIFARIEDLTEKNCRLLDESGCTHISIGLESTNPQNLKALNKPILPDVVQKNLEHLRKYHITSRIYWMIGLPYDTLESVLDYFEKSSMLPFDEYSLYPLIPYPGTQFWLQPERFDYEIIDKDFTHYVQIGRQGNTCFALKHKNFSPDDVRDWFTRIQQIFSQAGKIHIRHSAVAR